tara:strand:+ start:100 stop:312 length:213 start_codon:yes stop_codon:yes gene_type:complete
MWILLIVLFSQPFTVETVDILGEYTEKQACLKEQARAGKTWGKDNPHHASFGCIQLHVRKTNVSRETREK